LLNGLNNNNTWATLGLKIAHQYSSYEEFSVREIVPSNAGSSDQCMTLQMTQNVYLYQGDMVSLTVQVSGSSSQNAGFGVSEDAGGSGFCALDGELLT
jgi:hypothetical protein